MTELNLVQAIGALPSTKRGFGYHFRYGAGTKNGKVGREMIYTNGKSVIMRDITDPAKINFFSDHTEDVTAAAISPSGEWVCSGDCVGDMKIWGRTNQDARKFCGPSVKSVTDIVWDGEGKKVAVVGHGAAGRYAKICDWVTGTEVGGIQQHTGTLISVDYRKQRPFRIVCSGEDNNVSFHEGPPFKYKSILVGGTDAGHSGYPNKVLFSPGGEFYLSVGSDRKIILGDGKDGQKIREIESKENGHSAAIYSFDWSDDGKEFVTVSADKTAKIWNLESGEVTTTFTIAEDPQLDDMQMGVLWSGNDIVTVSLSGVINYLDRDAPAQPKQVIEGHKAKVTDMVTNKKGRIYSCDSSGKVCAWENFIACSFAGLGHVVKGERKGVKCIALSADCNILVSVGSDDKLKYNNATEAKWDEGGVALPKAVRSITCGRASDMVACTTNDSVLIYKTKGSEPLTITTSYTALCVAFSADDGSLAVGGSDDHVHIYDTSSGEEIHTQTTFNQKCESAEYSPDGKYLACGTRGNTLIFDKAWEQKNPTDWSFHSAKVVAVRWSPDGSKVATLGADYKLICWTDVENWKPVRAEKTLVHRVDVTTAAWLDNDHIITAGGDSLMKVWSV